MKILKIFGLVAGFHLLVFLALFVIPGCSAGKAQSPGSSADANANFNAAPPASPAIKLAPEDGGSPPSAPISFSPEGPAGAATYQPTRPGTPAAAALERQPVAGVTPASTYTVVSGDSLWRIAKRNHITVSDLEAANGLRSGSPLQVGQRLILPAKSGLAPSEPRAEPVLRPAAPSGRVSAGSVRHVVRPGETLGAIARKYGVRLGDIARANAIADPRLIHAGQELIIPGGRAGPETREASATETAPAAQENPPPAEAAPAPAPPADQDLDSGLKPAAPGEVPVVKVDQPADQDSSSK